LEDILADGPTPLCVGRTGNEGLTALGITANYFAEPHLDKKDMGFAFLSWFVKGKGFFFHSHVMYFGILGFGILGFGLGFRKRV
jgi:hypothetical protein